MIDRLRGKRTRGLAVAVALAVALSMVVAPAAVVGAQEEGPPPLPPMYHGDVTIDGEPAPAGATVEAVVDGEVRGSITLDEDGYYGSPDEDEERLVVTGTDADEGADVTFYVNADGYERGQADTTPSSVQWSSQTVSQVDLAADLDEASSGGGIVLPPSGGDDGGDSGDGGDAGPVAAIDVDPDPANVGETITFSGSGSETSADEITDFEWTIAGSSMSGESVTTSFDEVGTYNVELTVTDSAGNTDTDSTTVTVEVADGATPNAVISHDPAEPAAGDEVTFSAAESTTPEGELTDYEWTIDGATYPGEEVTHTFEGEGSYDVELTVTNDAGASDTATQTVTVGASDDGLPGFGVVAALVALLSAAAIANRRQR